MRFGFKDLMIEGSGLIVISFGRFNPPTIGHEKVIEKVKEVAGTAPFRIYPSHSTGDKDPLPHAKKIAYMRKMFPKYKRNIVADKEAKTVIHIAEKLYKEGFTDLIMVAGSDRVKEFDTLLQRYNGKPDRKGKIIYDFNSLKVVNAGQRDPDAEGVTGMSASKMRKAAADGDFDSFKMGIPNTIKDTEKKKLYLDVRKHMGIRERRDMGEMNTFEELRDKYLVGKIWKTGDLVEANGYTGKVVNRGTNYLSFADEDGKIHKVWLHEISIDERNYRKEYDNYHSKPEQVERRSSRNKARRAMGDKAVKGKDVGHKDNNPLNNDPDNLRNEDPSKNRREPRLREDNLDEMAWYRKVMAKIDQLTLPRGYDKVVKDYVAGMKDKEHKKHPSAWASEVARQYRMSPRAVIMYINKLVQKGALPKELNAEYIPEQHSFKKFVNQIQEKKIEGL